MKLLPLPDPDAPLVLEEHEGFRVVRDDLLDGGTKVRVAPACLDGYDEWVFAGPAQGYAQLALAIACRLRGKRASFFTAKRNELHPTTARAVRHGLRVHEVPYGRLTVVRARAREYVASRPSCGPLPDMGLALPGMEDGLVALARQLEPPEQAWVAAGSGLLSRALQRAWPSCRVNAVAVGMKAVVAEETLLWRSPEPFDKPAEFPPPFPSVPTFDAKVWRFASLHGQVGDLIWNVGA